MNLIKSGIFTSLFLLISCSTVFAQHSQQPEADQFFQALTLYENGQFEEAVRKFESFIERAEDENQKRKAHYYFTLANAAMNEDQTVMWFDRFIAIYPESEEAGALYTDLANRNYQQGNLADANLYYEKALDLRLDDSRRAQVIFWNAEVYVERNNNQQAHRYFRKVTNEFPRTSLAPDALYNIGRLYLMEERFSDATEAFEQLRRNYPAAEVTRRIGTALGEAYYRQGRYQETIDSLRRVLSQLDGDQESKAVFLIAESYNILDRLDEASTWYRRYISLNEGTPEERLAHYGLGWVFHKQGVYHWAAQSFGRAVTGGDELSRKALYYQAVNEKLSGRYDLALETFKKFGERYTSGDWVETANYEWAVIAFEIGDYVTAIERLQFLLRSNIRLERPGDVLTLLGEAQFANGEYGRAIESFERAERETAIDPAIRRQARFQRAWVLHRNRVYEEAKRLFDEVYRDDPTGELAGEALFWSADSYYNLEQFEPASSRFREFVQKFPDHEFIGAARYSLGWAYFKLGDYEQAISPLRDFLNNYQPPPVAIFPYDTDSRLRIADSFFALRRYQDAVNYYERSMVTVEGNDYASYQIASSFYRMDQTFDAVRAFRALINDFPQSSLREQAQYNIGYIYLLSGNSSQAVTEFQTLIERYPNSRWAPRAQYNIGNAYFNAEQFEQAIAAYQRVLDRFPRSELIVDAVNGIQFAQRAKGQSDTSNEILEDFIASNPQAGTADQLRFRQADNYIRTGNYEQAIQSFRQYLRVTNDERMVPMALYRLAEAHRQKGNDTELVETLETIINDHARSRQFDDALLDLGNHHLNRGRYNQAIERFQTLSNRSGMQFQANIGLGNAYLGLERHSDARRHFEAASNMDGDQDLVQVGLGRVALQSGDYSRARNVLSTVADRNTGAVGAEAQYLTGVALQGLRNHDAAIRAFANVRVLFRVHTDWVAKAMLGSVESNLRLGNRNEAEQTVRTMRDEFSGTSELRRAEQLLRN